MTVHNYELMIITRASLNEAAVQETIERFTTSIQALGGSVQKVDHWGKRAFAYEIEHMSEGYYTVIDLELEGEQLSELERQLKLADEIVRHKALRPDTRVKRIASSKA